MAKKSPPKVKSLKNSGIINKTLAKAESKYIKPLKFKKTKQSIIKKTLKRFSTKV